MAGMTGAQLYTFLLRRLGDDGNNVESARKEELYDYLTQGRDDVLQRLVLIAPAFFATATTLEESGSVTGRYALPTATADGLRVVALRDPVTAETLDASWYRWASPRELQLLEGISAENGLEMLAVLDAAAITDATTAAQVGLPTPCHRAIGLAAAVVALTADEASDAGAARDLYERAMERLESLYGDYDMNAGGAQARAALLGNYSDL